MIKNKINSYIEEQELKKKYINPYGFSGLIYLSDFETDYRGKNNINGSPIAQRICSNKRFDKLCKDNAIHRDLQNKNGGTE